jgi:hypothetical protein
MADEKQLIPTYVDADFDTIRERLKKLLSKVDNFQDYDFEGANITLLMEINAYVGDLQTYFANRLAQNIQTETADQYETVHSLVRQQGYEPTGYIGSELTLTVNINRTDEETNTRYFELDDQLFIPRFFTIDTGLKTDNNEPIVYSLTEPFTYDVTQADIDAELVTFDILLRQGEPVQAPLEFTGDDIVGNQIILPFKNWDMGTYPYENGAPSILVTVGENEVLWERISDFFDEISGLREVDNAYMLLFDKYNRYALTFSATRNVPSDDDAIKVYVLETLGEDGVVGAVTFDTANNIGEKPVSDTILGTPDVPFITNITQDVVVVDDQYDVYNAQASAGGANPQELNELKDAGKANAHRQYRNVTKHDYRGTLEARSDITVANVWGEQEQNPDVLDTTNYNRAYISLVPTEWDNDADSNVNYIDPSPSVGGEFANYYEGKTLDFPLTYNPDWTDQLLEYLEPYKMLGIWEEFILPELVYFRLDVGIKVKRTYNYTTVKEAVKNKLIWYFTAMNREFGEEIDFREITNYILDTKNVSPNDDFSAVRGINSLVIRDVLTYRYMVEEGATTTGGTGSGLTVDFTQDGGVIATATVNVGGANYLAGDTVSVDGGNNNSIITIDTVDGTGAATALTVTDGGTGYTYTADPTIDNLTIYEDNIEGNFPHFVELGYAENNADAVYNTLMPIKLGFNQFPRLADEFLIFVNEG